MLSSCIVLLALLSISLAISFPILRTSSWIPINYRRCMCLYNKHTMHVYIILEKKTCTLFWVNVMFVESWIRGLKMPWVYKCREIHIYIYLRSNTTGIYTLYYILARKRVILWWRERKSNMRPFSGFHAGPAVPSVALLQHSVIAV